jgi:hypothetical protein
MDALFNPNLTHLTYGKLTLFSLLFFSLITAALALRLPDGYTHSKRAGQILYFAHKMKTSGSKMETGCFRNPRLNFINSNCELIQV